MCSGSWDYSAALWDVQLGVLLRVVNHHQSVVQCCQFSLCGSLLATGSWDYTIHVYDVLVPPSLRDTTATVNEIGEEKDSLLLPNHPKKLVGNRPIVVRKRSSKEMLLGQNNHSKETISVNNMRTLVFHSSNIKCIAFSCDNLLASASWDCTVCLWHAVTGVRLRALYGHEGFVQTCTFSPNGCYVASAADDETVKVWCVKDGSLLKTLDAYAEEIHQLAFTEFGTLLSSGPEQLELCLY